MKIVCLSDTHNCSGEFAVPDGDLLIHSGDATVRGTVSEIEDFLGGTFSGIFIAVTACTKISE
jgi:predicted phosphodiesterase